MNYIDSLRASKQFTSQTWQFWKERVKCDSDWNHNVGTHENVLQNPRNKSAHHHFRIKSSSLKCKADRYTADSNDALEAIVLAAKRLRLASIPTSVSSSITHQKWKMKSLPSTTRSSTFNTDGVASNTNRNVGTLHNSTNESKEVGSIVIARRFDTVAALDGSVKVEL
jgi:hypothetical protein